MSHANDYSNALARGKRLLALLDNPATPQSPFTKISMLESHNWKWEHKQYYPSSGGVAQLYNDRLLRLGTGPDHNDTRMARHIDPAHPAGDKYFKQVFNVTDGSIIIQTLQSPQDEAKSSKIPLKDLPALRHWSDVTFLMYQDRADGNVAKMKGLRRIVHAVVSNDMTMHVMQHVLELGGRWKGWGYPGYKYTREEDGERFVALLGTPNAMGTAYLLAEHRVQLGIGLESIQVFREGEQYFLVLNVGVKAAEKVAEKGTEKEAVKGAEKEVARKTEK